MAGPFNHADYSAGAAFSRVGVIANIIRLALETVKLTSPNRSGWGDPQTWEQALVNYPEVCPQEVATAARQALRQSDSDWEAEQTIFDGRSPQLAVQEDWAPLAWEDPWHPGADPRSAYLDRAEQFPTHADLDIGLYGDGGHSKASGATFAALVICFGEEGRYWEEEREVTRTIASRMPMRRYRCVDYTRCGARCNAGSASLAEGGEVEPFCR